MMDIRLAAMDLDGTLLNGKKRVSEKTVRALRACEDKGVKIVLASGRSFESVAALAGIIGLKSPVISANGARADLSPQGEILFLDAFPRRLAEEVFAILRRTGCCFVIYGPGIIYQLNPSPGDQDRGLSRGLLYAGGQSASGGSVRVVREEDAAWRGLDQALKFVLFSKARAALQEAERLLRQGTPCQLSASDESNLEVMAPGGGKGRALAFLMGMLGLKKEQVMAFGDSSNDLDMLGAAGWPVAMENGLDSLKRLAFKIAPSCDRDGVGEILRQYVLEESL